MILQGHVKKTSTKEGKGKRGPWTLYSFILELDNGQESGWVSAGFDQPPFAEGSYGSLDTEATDRGPRYIAGSWKALDAPKRAAPATPATPETSATAPATKGHYVDRNDSIVYQSSRKDALAMVGLLLEHDALPLAAAGAKANTAKRFDEIKAYVDKFTVEFYGDVQTGRTLQQVVDAGAAEPASTDKPASAGAGASIDND